MKLIHFADVLLMDTWQIGERFGAFFVCVCVFGFFLLGIYLYDLTWHRLS